MPPCDFASGRNPCGGKKCLGLWIKFNGLNERRCYVLAYVIIIVNVVPCIFWHYINVDEVRWITLKKIITKCDGIITNCDSLVYYKVRWTVITNCDSFFITKCDTVYYNLRQVLQSAMDLLQISTGITKCEAWFNGGNYGSFFELISQRGRRGFPLGPELKNLLRIWI